jgi:hypothetical protein
MEESIFTDISKPIEACAAYYGDDAQAMRQYLLDGQQRATTLPNLGPIRFDDNGAIHQDILQAYSEYGFYIFENVLNGEELADIKVDLQSMRDNFSTEMGASKDTKGRPALGSGNKATTLQWAKPLSDPLGGTQIANGRHQVKLFEPTPNDDAP